ncbi:MAG: hypothetical protein NTX36_08025 [Proteobacteria bacterium]|nr:hypothetical protein [Pseudomonadota bacterium]
MKKKVLFIALAFLLTGGFMSVGLSQKAPLLSDINIVPPDPSLPEEIKSLSGKWSGKWNSKGNWDCVICVEKVDKDSAQLVYSWGEFTTAQGSCHCKPNWARIQKARVNYSEGKAIIEYSTPHLNSIKSPPNHPSHILTGTVDDPKGKTGTSKGGGGGRGQYDFSFTVEKSEPDIMKGHFVSGKASQLRIEMKRIDEAKN